MSAIVHLIRIFIERRRRKKAKQTLISPFRPCFTWTNFYFFFFRIMNGDHNNFDANHMELFSRRHSSRDTPSANNRDPNNKRYSLSATSTTVNRQTSINGDEPHSSAISIISGSRSTVSRTPSNLSTKNKPKRKKSATGSDHTDRSDSCRMKNRNTLTSSFLRRKRVEYAGN